MPAPLAQALYAESKQRLSERLQVTVSNAGSLARQVVRGSKCSENLRRSENLTNQMKMSLMQMRIIEIDNTFQKLDTCLVKYHNRQLSPDHG